ncbi:MAG: hypothetical protein ACLRWQ_03575 [Flavonifractor plautii]
MPITETSRPLAFGHGRLTAARRPSKATWHPIAVAEFWSPRASLPPRTADGNFSNESHQHINDH